MTITFKPTAPPNWRYRLALFLVPEFSRLRALNQDLEYQLAVATQLNGVDPDTARAQKKLGEDYTGLNEEFNEVAIYLRDNFKLEIESGKHRGLRLVDIFAMYCGKGRQS